MKTVIRFLMVAAVIAGVSPQAMAFTTATVPDGGSSAVLLALGAAGLVAARRLFRNK